MKAPQLGGRCCASSRGLSLFKHQLFVHAVMGKRASKVKQQGMHKHRSVGRQSSPAFYQLHVICLSKWIAGGLSTEVDQGHWPQEVCWRISRDVWATHCSDPAQVLKVKWTHFTRPPYSQGKRSNLDWNKRDFFRNAHKYLIKDSVLRVVIIKECGISP